MTFAASANIENAQKYHNAFNILDNVKDNNSKQTVEVNMLSSVNSYSPFQYIFSGFGIAIGRLFHFNPIIIFYLGRLFNLLYFILIMYFAIKKLPILKTMFFCIALLPMTLQLAASYSGDCVLISLVMYYIASCLNLAFKKSEPERKEIIILTVVSGVIATFKLVYLPLCFLFLIIPKKKYANTKKYFITLGIMAGVSVVSWLSWMLITSRYITMSNVMSDAATIHANIGFIFSNTFNYLLMIFNTLADKMQFYINSMIGSYLGWLDIPVNFVLVYGFILLLIITAVNNVRNEKFNFTRIQKLIMFVISFSVIILILTSMFVTWTKTGSKCIQGVQGRYFIPVLPLILMLFRNKTFFVKKSIDKAVILTACILQIITIINISSVITRV